MLEDEKKRFLLSLRSHNFDGDYPMWFRCGRPFADWIATDGIQYLYRRPFLPFLKRRTFLIHLELSERGPAFLMRFLRVANPSLPFDRIVEADVEPLIHELAGFSSTEYYKWREADVVARKYLPRRRSPLVLVRIEAASDADPTRRQSSLSALRLAVLYSRRMNLMVVDPVNALSPVDYRVEDPSGQYHYIVNIVDLTATGSE